MAEHKIQAHKIEKPFQLLAAWFIILFLLTGIFVTGASVASDPGWLAPLFAIAAVVYPLLVFGIVFALQTAFRPTLQSDDHYAQWLQDQQRFETRPKISVRKTPEATPQPSINYRRVELGLERIGERVAELVEKAELNQEGRTKEALKAEVEKLFKRESSKLEEIEENAKYVAEVVWTKDSEKVVGALVDQGYSAAIYKEPFNDDTCDSYRGAPQENTGIWLGSSVPLEMAQEVIRIGRKIMPQLRYIHLSADSEGPDFIDYQIFLGGSHETVKRYGISPLTDDDFEAIDQMRSLVDLHAIVRSKYKG